VPASSAPPHKESISIIGVGDIMLGTNYPSADYLSLMLPRVLIY
jgi:hypothetical protein